MSKTNQNLSNVVLNVLNSDTPLIKTLNVFDKGFPKLEKLNFIKLASVLFHMNIQTFENRINAL
jgi:hypothetical protein